MRRSCKRIGITPSFPTILLEKSTQNGIAVRDVMQTHCRELFHLSRLSLPASRRRHHRCRRRRCRYHCRRRRCCCHCRRSAVSLCEIGPCEKLENDVRVSLFFFSLFNARLRHNSFPNRRGTARSRRPTFLS